jgi:hypothetical protein
VNKQIGDQRVFSFHGAGGMRADKHVGEIPKRTFGCKRLDVVTLTFLSQNIEVFQECVLLVFNDLRDFKFYQKNEICGLLS